MGSGTAGRSLDENEYSQEEAFHLPDQELSSREIENQVDRSKVRVSLSPTLRRLRGEAACNPQNSGASGLEPA